MLDFVEFDSRTQEKGESFNAIQQIAQDTDLTCEPCQMCKVACFERWLAAHLISDISYSRTRTKLLEEEKFPSKDHVVGDVQHLRECKDEQPGKVRQSRERSEHEKACQKPSVPQGQLEGTVEGREVLKL